MAGVQAKQRSLHTQEVFAKQMRNNLNLMSLGSCMCAFAQVFADRLHFVLCCAMLRCVSLPFQSKRAQSPLVGSPNCWGWGAMHGPSDRAVCYEMIRVWRDVHRFDFGTDANVTVTPCDTAKK